MEVGVGEPEVMQSKTASNVNVEQFADGLGVGVGQTEENKDESKSGQVLLLDEGPEIKQSVPKFGPKHH